MGNKCIDVIEENWQMRAEDLREFYELETSGIDEARNEEGVLFNASYIDLIFHGAVFILILQLPIRISEKQLKEQ